MSHNPTKYYKNVFKIIVLSEYPLDNLKLEDLNYVVTEGDCVLHTFNCSSRVVEGKTMANLLSDAGSEPGFFQLDEYRF